MRNRRTRVGAYALCLDSDRVLLCRMSGRTRNPGRWTLPGGGVGHGEHPADAARRELLEETGLTGSVVRLLGVQDDVYTPYDDTSIHGVRLLYLLAVTRSEVLRPESDGGVDAVQWIAIDELPDLDLSAHAREGLRLAGVAFTCRGRQM